MFPFYLSAGRRVFVRNKLFQVNLALLVKYHYVFACSMSTYVFPKPTSSPPKASHACVRPVNAGTYNHSGSFIIRLGVHHEAHHTDVP